MDDKALKQAAKTFPDASRHKDWRDLLSRHTGAFDAVAIPVPDHMHAPPAVAALRAKKHLYLQKLMAGTLHECRVLTQKAALAGVVTELGNQGQGFDIRPMVHTNWAKEPPPPIQPSTDTHSNLK